MYSNNEMLIYAVVINVVAFIAYGIDKRRAIRNEWRISEKTLLLLTAVGGSIGALVGMRVFRHKTKKPQFSVGVPFILFVHIIVVVWWMK